jgi:hypothetical protein
MNLHRRIYRLTNDPELLPDLPVKHFNRAQFADVYLRKLLNNKHRNLTYSKSNPTALIHNKYFDQLNKRLNETGHIGSFEAVITAFA